MSSPTYPPPPRSGLPSWVWACTFCAVLPLIGVILLGIFAVPALRSLRQAARERRTSGLCMENVRQTCMAVQMYVQDYDDRYPLRDNWMDSNLPYDKDQKLYQCPTVRAKNPTANGYAYNSKLSGKKGKDITAPS